MNFCLHSGYPPQAVPNNNLAIGYPTAYGLWAGKANQNNGWNTGMWNGDNNGPMVSFLPVYYHLTKQYHIQPNQGTGFGSPLKCMNGGAHIGKSHNKVATDGSMLSFRSMSVGQRFNLYSLGWYLRSWGVLYHPLRWSYGDFNLTQTIYRGRGTNLKIQARIYKTLGPIFEGQNFQAAYYHERPRKLYGYDRA